MSTSPEKGLGKAPVQSTGAMTPARITVKSVFSGYGLALLGDTYHVKELIKQTARDVGSRYSFEGKAWLVSGNILAFLEEFKRRLPPGYELDTSNVDFETIRRVESEMKTVKVTVLTELEPPRVYVTARSSTFAKIAKTVESMARSAGLGVKTMTADNMIVVTGGGEELKAFADKLRTALSNFIVEVKGGLE